MKRTIHKILHWINLSIITLILMLVVLLSTIYFISSRFDDYRNNFEKFVSKAIRQPVQIETISVGSRGLEPILKLHNVIIFNDAKTKKLLQAKEMQVGIDLVGSLLRWRIKPGLLLLRGSELNVYQDKEGHLGVTGIVSAASDKGKLASVSREIFSWLFEQSSIDLENIVLNCRLAGGQIIKITDLRLQLYNGVLQHDLKVHGKLEQRKSLPATFAANFKLHGDFLDHAIFPLTGEVELESLVADLNLDGARFSDDSFLIPPIGDISLTVKNSKVITKIFRQPMLINKISSKIYWHSDSKGLKIDCRNLSFIDKYLEFNGDTHLLFLKGVSLPTADIKLKFKLANLARAKLYYPVTMLPPRATVWLDQAFTSSKIISGSVVLRGPLDKFPFDHKEGEFVVDSIIRDVYLHYDRDWPQVENIYGTMVFSNRTMTIISHGAKIIGDPTKFITTTIPDLEFPILYVEGEMNTTSSKGLKFVNTCPLKNTVGRKLQDISLNGPIRFSLKMKMPLSEDIANKNTQVNGKLELTNNNLKSLDLGFEIGELNGNLQFNDGDLHSDIIHGKLFAKPISLKISTLNPELDDSITRISIVGRASVPDFEKVFLVKLSSYASGDFDYEGLLDLHSVSSPNIFKLNSSLLGVAVKLPKPFDKKATDTSKFNLACYFGGNKLPQVDVNYNDQINSALVVKKEGADYLKVLAGELKFGATPAKVSATSGLVISGDLDVLDWEVWKEYLSKAHTSISEAASIIRQISLNVKELHILGQIFHKISLMVRPQNNGLDVGLIMTDIDGSLFVPHDPKATVKGEFKKLYFSDAGQKELTTFKPQDLPPLNVKIDDLRYDNSRFGKVTFITEPQNGGLKINKVTISDTGFNLDANGEWLAGNGNQNTLLRGKIRSNDVGGLLKQKDITDTVVDGKGEVNFVLKWPASPYAPTMQTLNGNCSFYVANGRIISLSKRTEGKLGFGKVLGVLSLQSLPRRLSLDFSDLTKKGFGFDSLKGDIEFKSGNVLVKKLNIDGPVANVKAYGKIGLKNKDYDLMLSAIPQITASVPVAAAIAGGPVIGAITLVAEKIVSTAIKKAAVYSYHVTGAWGMPDHDVAKP